MTYSPDIFSTKGGLNSLIIRDWIARDNRVPLVQWLASGNSHPRLAAEALGAAVDLLRPDLAEQIWQANWHKPGAALKEMWEGWRCALINAQAMGLGPREQATWEWLLDKTQGATDKKTAKLQSDYRLYGMQLAMNLRAPQCWEDLLASQPDMDSETGHQTFCHVLNDTSWFKGRKNTAWAEQGIQQMIEAGLKPGGSIWVRSLEEAKAKPFFDFLLERAAALTTPRMRAAIVVTANTTIEVQPNRFETLLDTFLALGMPREIAMNPKEKTEHLTATGKMNVALENKGYDGNSLDTTSQVERLFGGATLDVAKACLPELQEQLRVRLRASTLDHGLPNSTASAPKPRF